MKISKIWRIRPKRKTPEQLKRSRKRREALSQPIALEQVAAFSSHLVQVDYGSDGGCWLYAGRSSAGATKSYGRMKFNGELILAHRFALAVKEGCTVWDLDGWEAAHASKGNCMGGRCCRPDHLKKKLGDPNHSWDRAKDAAIYGDKAPHRNPKEIKKMLDAMYPRGLAPNQPLFDEPWQSNVSRELLAFLEMGLREDFKQMQQTRMEGSRLGQ